HDVLDGGFHSCRDLSQSCHQSEKEIIAHLEHLRLSLRQQGKKLVIDPATCRKCGYAFDHRTRLAKPGKCPACRATSIEPPLFTIGSR
ncbi:MAG: transcriptional regulator, partial [Desulfuromonadales bacterium]|nr:transcriptional regulator [Desulfuromonadales bacterium]